MRECLIDEGKNSDLVDALLEGISASNDSNNNSNNSKDSRNDSNDNSNNENFDDSVTMEAV